MAAFLLPNDLLTHPPTLLHLGSKSDYDYNYKIFVDRLAELGVPTASVTLPSSFKLHYVNVTSFTFESKQLTEKALEKGNEGLSDFYVKHLECTKDEHSAEIPEEELNEFKRHLVQSMGAQQLAQLVTHVHTFKVADL